MFEEIHVNFLGVILAAAAYFLLGAIWYSPKALGGFWMKHEGPEGDKYVGPSGDKHAGCDKCDMSKCCVSSYVGEFVLDLVSAYMLALFIGLTHAPTAKHGLIIGLLVWLGFLFPTQLSGVIWGKRSFKCFLVHILFLLVAFLVMGAIIGAMQYHAV